MKCRRCNRPLKREPYRTLGIGKICAAKEAADRERAAQETDDIIIPYDGGDIWIERLESDRKTTSQLRTNIQRIEYRHSPTGFNFGYGGSGPADTALNVMLMFTDKETANKIYQDFKWKFLGEDCNKLVIPKQKILDFIIEEKRKLITKNFQDSPNGTLFYAHGRTIDNEDFYLNVEKEEVK